MKLYYPITVDLYNPHPLPRMNAQQHNVGRGALITLTANGQVIVLDEETVRIFAKRPDKNTSYLDCSILEGKIQADFTDQMLAAEGIVEVELELTTTETNITTPIFIVEVNKSNVKEGVQSSNEYKALEKYTAEAKEAAEQAQEVYDNIPNYEAILEANSILSKTSGEVVTTTDSAKVKPKNIKLFGKGKQNTVPGNQMLEKFTGSGMNSTLSDDGLSVVSEAKTGANFINMLNGDFNAIQLLAGKTYYVSMDIKLVSGSLTKINSIQLMDSSSTTIKTQTDMLKPSISASYQRYAIKVDAETDAEATKIYVQGYVGTDAVVEITNVMISESTYEWEPFVGNEPSPNMNYPQKPEFLGESGSIESKVLTGNLLHPNFSLVNCTYDGDGVYSVKSNTGTVVINCTSASLGIQEMRIPNGDVYLSLKIEATNACTVSNVFLCTQGSYNKNYMFGVNKTVANSTLKISNVFSLTNDVTHFGVAIHFSEKTPEGLKIKNVQLRLGSEEKAYEPYTEQPFTFLTPNGLRGIPLGQTIPDAIKNSPIHMSGVYWDEAEQQYHIANTKNENGKDVQRIGKVTMSSSWKWSKTSDNATIRVYLTPNHTDIPSEFADNPVMAKSTVMCTTIRNDYVDENTLRISIDSNPWLRIDNASQLSVEDFKTKLDESNSELYYILADPIITDTTDEEKAQLDALVMNYPNTTVVNDAGAYMEVEYVADTKKHIEQNYTPKSVTEDILERLGNAESQIALNS